MLSNHSPVTSSDKSSSFPHPPPPLSPSMVSIRGQRVKRQARNKRSASVSLSWVPSRSASWVNTYLESYGTGTGDGGSTSWVGLLESISWYDSISSYLVPYILIIDCQGRKGPSKLIIGLGWVFTGFLIRQHPHISEQLTDALNYYHVLSEFF